MKSIRKIIRKHYNDMVLSSGKVETMTKPSGEYLDKVISYINKETVDSQAAMDLLSFIGYALVGATYTYIAVQPVQMIFNLLV